MIDRIHPSSMFHHLSTAPHSSILICLELSSISFHLPSRGTVLGIQPSCLHWRLPQLFHQKSHSKAEIEQDEMTCLSRLIKGSFHACKSREVKTYFHIQVKPDVAVRCFFPPLVI